MGLIAEHVFVCECGRQLRALTNTWIRCPEMERLCMDEFGWRFHFVDLSTRDSRLVQPGQPVPPRHVLG